MNIEPAFLFKYEIYKFVKRLFLSNHEIFLKVQLKKNVKAIFTKQEPKGR